MSWNYRIVKYADGSGFGVHEVHYDDDGNAKSMTEEPVRLIGTTEKNLREELILVNTEAKRRPVFDEPKEWADRER